MVGVGVAFLYGSAHLASLVAPPALSTAPAAGAPLGAPADGACTLAAVPAALSG